MSAQTGTLSAASPSQPIVTPSRSGLRPGHWLLLGLALQVCLVLLSGVDRSSRLPWGQMQVTFAAAVALLIADKGRLSAATVIERGFRRTATLALAVLLAVQALRLVGEFVPALDDNIMELGLTGLLVVWVVAAWRWALRDLPEPSERMSIHLDGAAVFFTVAAGVMLLLGGRAMTVNLQRHLGMPVLFAGLMGALLVLYLAVAPRRQFGGWPPLLIGLLAMAIGSSWQLMAGLGGSWGGAHLISACGALLASFGAATWTAERDAGATFMAITRRVRETLPLATIAAAPALLVGNELLRDRSGSVIALGVDLALSMVLILCVSRQTVLLRERGRILREATAASERERNVVLDLQHSEERFRSLVQNSSDVYLILRRDGTVSYQSPAVERVLGYAVGERLGHQIFELTHPDDTGRVQAVMHELAATPDAQRTIELRTKHADGSWRDLQATGTNMLADPVVAGIVVNYRDVTEQRQLERELTRQAFHDPLTGLANRALFGDRVTHALQHRGDVPALAVLLLDLDDFKTLNDSLGHAAGDQALIVVADRLGAQVRPEDTVSRLGGDEFVVLLEGADAEVATRVADRLLSAVRSPLDIAGKQVHLEASLGVAFSGPETRTADDLLRNADVAMYSAKQRGKGRVELFEPSMREAVLNRLELRGDLERAIRRSEFQLRYQPIFDLTTGAIHSFEALLRWQHPTRGDMAPGDFIPLAEETGLIVPIGQWVLERACAQASTWSRAGHGELAICVNLSARQLRDPSLVPGVSLALGRAGLAADRLVLELTESGIMHDDDGRLTALRHLGVHLSLDDFGTGYSSLSSLSRFPIEILKIDQSFIAQLGSAADESALVRSVVQLGLAMKMSTVAEGVERPEQLAHVRALGCTHAQGFLLGRPMDADSATHLITTGDRLRSVFAA